MFIYIYYYFKLKENCILCNLNFPPSLSASFRWYYQFSNFIRLFKIVNADSLRKLFYYINQCCRVKSFIIIEWRHRSFLQQNYVQIVTIIYMRVCCIYFIIILFILRIVCPRLLFVEDVDMARQSILIFTQPN